jgi:hypothetical protein
MACTFVDGIIPMLIYFFVLCIPAGITCLLVAGFDEGFKPCPNYKNLGTTCSRSSTGKQVCKQQLLKFDTFCGQTMHPRVTTCCRVPCFQNFTTHFDSDGNPADCYSQPFETMVLSIIGYSCLSVGVVFSAFFYWMSTCFPDQFTFNMVFCWWKDTKVESKPPASSNTELEVTGEAIPDDVDSRNRGSDASGVEQVQVV